MAEGRSEKGLRLLGKDAGGCTESCSEMHTFSWPCEQAVVPVDLARPWRWRWYRWFDRHVLSHLRGTW